MSKNIRIKTDKDSLFGYIESFQEGKIQIPAFQRDFIWTPKQRIDLLESIEKGYPIGSILLWRPDFTGNEDLYKFESERIGSYQIPERSEDFFYILDGFQRLSTLFGGLINPYKTNLDRNVEGWRKDFNIIYDLNGEEDEPNFEVLKKSEDNLDFNQIPIYKLIDPKEFFDFQRNLFNRILPETEIETYLRKFENISKALQVFELPSINIYGGTVSDAVDIFQRLNSRGSQISPDWIVSALSFNKDRGFKLGQEINNFLEKISIYNFENLKRSVILQCITNSFGGVYFDKGTKGKKLEALAKRTDFVDKSRETFIAIEKAIKFLFEHLFVLDSKLLPYNSQLVFITDFYAKIENPTQNQINALKRWFWITTYSNYFTRYNLSKQRRAYEQFQAFLKDEKNDPVYYDTQHKKFETVEFPIKISMGSVRAKALVLFMLNFQFKNKKIDEQDIEEFKVFKLFKEKDIITENTAIIMDNSVKKRREDLSELFNSKEDFNYIFITDEVKRQFLSGNKDQALAIRKKEIIRHEEQFVLELDIEYI